MNQENRQKVLDWCTEEDSYPLYFKGYESTKDEFDPEKHSVDSMIKRVLELSKKYPSYNSNTNEFESSIDRWRSSLDIWRHIIYYYPTIEIFDVMHELYKLYLVDIKGQFCNDIERRTFKVLRDDECRCPSCRTNYMTAFSMKNYTDSCRSTDEYDLDWEDWKDI